MNSLGYHNNYDQFVLAGSSLGFTQDKYPQWGEALLDHMSIGQGLHGFRFIKVYLDKSSLSIIRTVVLSRNFIQDTSPKKSWNFILSICR
jgi:hypothetical protein